MATIEPNGNHVHHHAVRFYGNDAELVETVGAFLSQGLTAGQPAVVIVTPQHGIAIEAMLESHLIDVGAAKRLGDLVMLDADEILATFTVDQFPVGSLFRRSVGGIIEQVRRGRERTPVRAFGEMVDVLWKQGKADAAIRLEVLWNNLAETHSFSLLCSYSIGNFYKETDKYHEVCELHTYVHPHTDSILPFTPKTAAEAV